MTVRFQIGRFLQVYASSAIVEIVISDPDFDGANRLALGSHFAEEALRYGPKLGQYPFLIGNVFSNCRERHFLGFRVSPFDLLGPTNKVRILQQFVASRKRRTEAIFSLRRRLAVDSSQG